jgi:Uma2 family endonuclease
MHRETAKTAALSMTLDEYILFEEQSEQRHEFIDNQLFLIPGTTDDHNYICQNIAFLLRSNTYLCPLWNNQFTYY